MTRRNGRLAAHPMATVRDRRFDTMLHSPAAFGVG
jgi:hypothetical protein